MIVIDSEFQSLIPPLSDDEYQRLEKSLVKNGYQDWREPIITWNGTIIDGHNRYNICDEHGIKFKTMEMEFESRDAAKIWIIENQFKRRNLSKYDRSVLALQLEPLYAAEAKRRQQVHGSTAPGKPKSVSQKSDEVSDDSEEGGKSYHLRTDEQLAKLAGTSRDTIRKVRLKKKEIVARQARERHAANGGDRKSEAYRKSATPNLGEPIDKHDGETLEQLARDIPMGHEGLRGLGDPLTGEPPKSHAT